MGLLGGLFGRQAGFSLIVGVTACAAATAAAQVKDGLKEGGDGCDDYCPTHHTLHSSSESSRSTFFSSCMLFLCSHHGYPTKAALCPASLYNILAGLTRGSSTSLRTYLKIS